MWKSVTIVMIERSSRYYINDLKIEKMNLNERNCIERYND
jgi:hypothetical protein